MAQEVGRLLRGLVEALPANNGDLEPGLRDQGSCLFTSRLPIIFLAERMLVATGEPNYMPWEPLLETFPVPVTPVVTPMTATLPT